MNTLTSRETFLSTQSVVNAKRDNRMFSRIKYCVFNGSIVREVELAVFPVAEYEVFLRF